MLLLSETVYPELPICLQIAGLTCSVLGEAGATLGPTGAGIVFLVGIIVWQPGLALPESFWDLVMMVNLPVMG
jgi:hypothetical protein